MVFALIFFSFFNAESWGADWQLYALNESAIYYYDGESIEQVSGGVFRVWGKVDQLAKGVEFWVGRMGEQYRELHHNIVLTEINCVERKTKLLYGTRHKQDGSILGWFNYEEMGTAKWGYVIPDSVDESLLNVICKKAGF